MSTGRSWERETGPVARSPLIPLAGLLLLATATRLYRLTHWPLVGDEFFTITDSLTLNLDKSKPLLFVLNHYLVEPWLGLDALGARLLPVLFGIGSVLVLYWAGRALLDGTAGLVAALLAIFNPWHLYMSQYARYYTLVFLLASAFTVALYLGYRRSDVRWLAAGLVLAGLGVLAHPSAGLVFGAICLWAVADTAWDYLSGEPVSRVRIASAGVLPLVVAAVGLAYFVPILVGWSGNAPEVGFAGPVLAMSFGQWMTAGTCLFAAAGAVWMWRTGDRKTATYLLAIVAFPFLFLSVGGYFLRANVPFLFPAAPAVFLLAGHFLARLVRALRSQPVTARLIAGVVLLAGIATGLPSFLSHYMDGSRPDYRTAAHFLEGRQDPATDIVLSDLSNSLAYYLASDVEVRGFERTVEQLESAVGEAARDGAGGDVWITPWIKDRGGFNDAGLGAVTGWVRSRCVLERRVSWPRLDFRRNAVDVYRCPRGRGTRPSTAGASGPSGAPAR